MKDKMKETEGQETEGQEHCLQVLKNGQKLPTTQVVD
jgi:hypothetical protein